MAPIDFNQDPRTDPNVLFYGVFSVDYIPSVNNYLINKGNVVTLTDEVRDIKHAIGLQIDKAKLKFKDPGDYGLVARVIIVLKQSFLKRDLDNTLKAIIDGVFQRFHINDSRITDIYASKVYQKGSPYEYVKVVIYKSGHRIPEYSL